MNIIDALHCDWTQRRPDPACQTRQGVEREQLITDDGENLIQGFKRANNSPEPSDVCGWVEYSFGGGHQSLRDGRRAGALFDALDTAEAQDQAGEWRLRILARPCPRVASLRGAIDRFFDAGR